jgi:hypothetical protein
VVVVNWYKLDKWTRKVGIARVEGADVCLEQIRRGLAVHFKYQHEQSQVRASGVRSGRAVSSRGAYRDMVASRA